MAARDGLIELPIGDGRYPCRLRYGELKRVQEACDAGPGHIANVLRQGIWGPWRIEYVREAIRWGLIGGGMSAPKALQHCERHIDDRLGDYLEIAWAILAASITGPADEKIEGKAARGRKKATVSRAARSPSPESTASAPSSATHPPISTA